MTPQEIYSQFLKPDQKILHLGCGDRSLEKLSDPDDYYGVEFSSINDLNLDVDFSNDFDYVVLDEILELVDNPLELIKNVKYLGETIVLWEIKYEHYENLDKKWKKPWANTPLNFFIEQNFDYTQQIFLGYATIHFCSMPFEKEDYI